MATNVSFLRGTQDQLNKLTSFQEGSFYLTSDSDRLYFAQDSKELVLLNHSVTVKNNLQEIQNIPAAERFVGDFYYATLENILCTYTASGWQQINPDTNTDTSIQSFNATKTAGSENIIFDIKLTQQNKEVRSGNTIGAAQEFTAQIVIDRDDIAQVATEAKVGLEATINNSQATIKPTGTGSNNTSAITVKGESGVSVSGTKDNITIKGTTYEMTSPANTSAIKLTDSDGSGAGEVAFAAGTQMSVSGADSGKITYSHGAVNVTKKDLTGNTPTEPGFGGNVKVISDLVVGDNGHVTSYTTENIKLPAKPVYKVDQFSVDKGTLAISIKEEGSGAVSSASIDNGLYYTINDVAYYNQAKLPVYTKTQIDNFLNDVNAMVYRGTVDGPLTLSNKVANAKRGDTYMIVTNDDYTVSVNGAAAALHPCRIGDLVIANGTEVNGKLTSVTWDYIPSGNDIDTEYLLSIVNVPDSKVKITLVNQVDNTENSGSVTFASDDVISIATKDTSADAVSAGNSEITISHKAYETEELTKNGTPPTYVTPGSQISVLTEVDTVKGHVTGYRTTTFEIGKAEPIIKLEDNTTNILLEDGNSTFNTSKIPVASGNDSVSVSNNNGGILISHKNFGTSSGNPTKAELSHGQTFNAIDSLIIDNGHVSGISTKAYTLPAEVKLVSHTIGLGSATGGVKVTSSVADSYGPIDASYNLITSTKSLEIAASGSSISVNLVWGSFGS